MTGRRYLLELTVRDPATGADTVLRLTERSSYTTRVTDSPAVTWYRPYARRAVNYEISLLGGGRGIGEFLLNNGSRWLDAYRGHAWVSARLLEGPLGRFVPYSAFSPLFAGYVAGRDYQGSDVTVRVSEAAAWGAAVPRRYYLGNNSGPNGLEGNADLAGRVVPVCMGYVFNMVPELVNPSLLIYQCNDTQTAGITAKVRGLPLNDAGDVGISITSPSLSIAAGAYVRDEARGLFRLGSTGGTVTCDVWGTPAFPTPAAQVAQLASRMGITTPVALESNWATSLGNMTGILVPDGASGVDLLDTMIGDPGGWWRLDANGGLHGGSLTPAETMTVSRSLAVRDYVGGLDDASLGDDWDVPVWRLEHRSRRNQTVMRAEDLHPSVPTSEAGRLTKEWTVTTIERPDVKAIWPQARQAVVESTVINGGGAAWMALRSKPRRLWAATVAATQQPGTWPLGQCIQLQRPGGLAPVKVLHAALATEDGRTFTIKGFA